MLKLALIVWIGAILVAKEPLLGQVKHELIPIVFPGALLAIGLVLAGRDLGTAMIMGAAVLGAMIFGGLNWRTIGLTIAGSLAGVLILVITSPNRMARLFSFADGHSDYSLSLIHI